MSRQPGLPMAQVFLQHARWLEDQGPSYKAQALECRAQAASLTRLNYNVIGVYRRNHEYKRS
jgi:hypothetical protein